MSSILIKAENYVKEKLVNLSPDLKYHNMAHTFGVRDACVSIGNEMKIKEEDLEILQLAALFHDTGFLDTYQGHERISKKYAEAFLKENNYPSDKLAKVLQCIEATISNREPQTKLEKVIKDADMAHLSRRDYLESIESLRYEWATFLDKHYNEYTWDQINYDFIKNHHFYTKAAIDLFGKAAEANLKRLKKARKKNKKKLGVGNSIIEGNRSAQMMFKTSLRNHLDLSALADNKANIMLSVNALIITIIMPVAVSFIKGSLYLLVPLTTLLLTCLASMIYATLATRPIKMNGTTSPEKIQNGKANLFFFGNFYKMNFEEYKVSLQDSISREEALDDAIMRDLFFLGKSLGLKYSQLRVCYTIFMVGITLSVITFGLSYGLFIGKN